MEVNAEYSTAVRYHFTCTVDNKCSGVARAQLQTAGIIGHYGYSMELE